jgi:hypothetical protein
MVEMVEPVGEGASEGSVEMAERVAKVIITALRE